MSMKAYTAYPDFGESSVFYGGDYWEKTPAYDALNALSGDALVVAFGVLGILVTAFAAYGVTRKKAPCRPVILGNSSYNLSATSFWVWHSIPE